MDECQMQVMTTIKKMRDGTSPPNEMPFGSINSECSFSTARCVSSCPAGEASDYRTIKTLKPRFPASVEIPCDLS